MRKILFLLIASIFFNFFFSFDNIYAATKAKIFTAQELSKFDGKNGNKAYTAYRGVVYDVTDSKLWELGEHFGLRAGIDLTEEMKEAPHGDEVLKGFEVVGSLAGYQQDNIGQTTKNSTKWYQKRIKLLGLSLLGWSGILLGVFFVLTFATCFALPWAKLPLPWKGSRIGPDSLDNADKHLTWSSTHKHFVWITVILGIVHGIIGFLQMLGIYL